MELGEGFTQNVYLFKENHGIVCSLTSYLPTNMVYVVFGENVYEGI